MSHQIKRLDSALSWNTAKPMRPMYVSKVIGKTIFVINPPDSHCPSPSCTQLLETRASPAPWIAAITSVFIHDNDELYSECLSETIIRSSYHVDCVS